MDGVRFDRWTRRRFGSAMGGLAGSLVGLGARQGTDAKRRRPHRCRKATQRCASGGSGRRCCGGLTCQVFGLGPDERCCKAVGATCSSPRECCGLTGCQAVNFVPGNHCCTLKGDTCSGQGSESNCCQPYVCTNGTCFA